MKVSGHFPVWKCPVQSLYSDIQFKTSLYLQIFCLRLEHLNLHRGQEGLLCVFTTFFFISPLILLPPAAPELPGTEQALRRGNTQRNGNAVSWPVVELCRCSRAELFPLGVPLRAPWRPHRWELLQVGMSPGSGTSLWHGRCSLGCSVYSHQFFVLLPCSS